MSDSKEVLGEIKVGGCTYLVTREKSEPGVISLEGVTCTLREDLEKGNQLIEALFSGVEVRYRPPKLVVEEDSGGATEAKKVG